VSKIRPTRKVPRFELHNCTGRLRVDVKQTADGDLEEVINLPKGGGCKVNLQAIGKLITAMLECNIDPWFIVETLESVDACTAVKDRSEWKEGKIKKEEMGFGGCPRIIARAMREKLEAKK